VPEDRHRQGLVLGASLSDNITVGSWRALRRTHRRADRRAAGELVARLRIRTPGVDAPASALSGGNQQKVVVARCLTQRPSVLLLDEPTRGIDIGAKHELYELLGDLLEQGVAIILASSELGEILGLADRVLVLHDRCVIAELPREEATQERIALLSAGGGVRDRAA